jgi:hypothetical protein
MLKRPLTIFGCGVLAFAAAAISAHAVVQRTARADASKAPAAQKMRALHAPATSANAVPQPPREALADLPGVRMEQARQLISGIGSKAFAVSAVPTVDGGVCIATPAGGGCFPEFDADGVSFSTGMNSDGRAALTDRELIAGVASDDVRRIDAVTNAGKLSVPLRNNAFVYEGPTVGVWADALEVTFTDGTKSRALVANANRVEPIP